MINKLAASAEEAVANVKDGATVLIGGFGTAGIFVQRIVVSDRPDPRIQA